MKITNVVLEYWQQRKTRTPKWAKDLNRPHKEHTTSLKPVATG